MIHPNHKRQPCFSPQTSDFQNWGLLVVPSQVDPQPSTRKDIRYVEFENKLYLKSISWNFIKKPQSALLIFHLTVISAPGKIEKLGLHGLLKGSQSSNSSRFSKRYFDADRRPENWKGIGWLDRKTLGWSLSRTGGTWGFHDSWYLPVTKISEKNNQTAQKQHTKDHLVGCERICRICKVMTNSKRKLSTPLSSTGNIIIRNLHQNLVTWGGPQDGGGGRQSRQSTLGMGRLDPIWNDSIFTCLHHAFIYNMFIHH